MEITLDHVQYKYHPGTVNEKTAVRDVSLHIGSREFIALAGSTGSGKSTLVQLINGLKLPAAGSITYDGRTIGNDKKELHKIRCKVGLVFQYPEYQLFDESVLKDVSFGPKNKGLSADEARESAKAALRDVGLLENLWQKSPFDLSGGEKRRAAIAGILAMKPEVLILDEPTAGLDPAGKTEILDLIRDYQKDRQMTVIMVSHNMDEIAEYAHRVIVMSEGKILMDAEPHEVFRQKEQLDQICLSVPQVTEFCRSIGINGVITVQEAADEIFSFLSE